MISGYLAIPVVDPQMHAGRHEQQQRLLLTQLFPEPLDHFWTLIGSLKRSHVTWKSPRFPADMKRDGVCRKIPSLSGFHCGCVISWPSGHPALHRVPVELWVAPPPQDSGRWAPLVGCTTYCHTAGSSWNGRSSKMGKGRTRSQAPHLKKRIKVLH